MYCLDTQYNVLPFCITELKYVTFHEIGANILPNTSQKIIITYSILLGIKWTD